MLAVQTLRNSLMAATMTVSTAALGLMGAVTLAAPSLNTTFGDASSAHFTARLALELVLMMLFFSSLVCSAMAARFYNPPTTCQVPNLSGKWEALFGKRREGIFDEVGA